MKSEPIELTREEIYTRIWSMPTTKLAAQLGISDVALGKICRRLNVPKPPPGAWRRLETGFRLRRPPLPKLRPGDLSAVTFRRKPEQVTVINEYMATLMRQEQQRPEIYVADDFRRAHPLVRKTRKSFSMLSRRDSHRMRDFASLYLDVRVSHALVRRALLIMDAIIKALEARGCSVEIGKENDKSTCAIIGEDRVHMYLWEKDNRSENKAADSKRTWEYDRWVFTPSGRLTFTIDEYWDGCKRKNWTDKVGKPLEQQLNAVIVGILTAAEALRLRRLKRQEEERIRKEEALRREEERKRLQIEQERRHSFDDIVASWIRSQKLIEFIDLCERSQQVSSDAGGTMWLLWVRRYAEGLDPFKNGSLNRLVGSFDEFANGPMTGQ